MASINYGELIDKAEMPEYSEPPPVGRYRAVVVSRKEKPTKKGKEQLAVRWKVTEGPQKDKAFFLNLIVSPESPSALGMFFDQFSRLGGNVDALRMGASLMDSSTAFIGVEADVTLIHNDYYKDDPAAIKVNGFKVVVPGSPPPTPIEAPAVAAAPAAAPAGMPF